MDPHEEPLQRFLKTTSDDWLMGDPKPFRKPQEGGETPPYVSISRFNSVYYVRKMRNLDRAVSEILAWIKAKPERMKLFIGFSKDPETSLPPFPGITFDPLSQLEFESWRAGEDIYGDGHVTIPVDHHPNAESISRVVLQTSKGNVSLGDGKFGFIGFGVDTPRYLSFGVVIVDAEDIEGRIEEGSGATYTVKGGRDDGESFESIVWCFSDDPEGDGGEAMVRSAGDEDSDYATFMKAMVDHHIEDVIAVIHRVMVRSGLFRTAAEARQYLYTHDIPGGDWKNKGKGPEGEGEYDYVLVSRLCAPLLPDEHGNWSSAAGSRLASPGIDGFGILTRDSEIFDAAARVSRQFAGTGNWGLMEWNPDSRRNAAAWKESLDFVARYGVHIVSLQGWEEVQKSHNEIARQALADFLVEMGSQPYEPGENNLAARQKQPTKPSSLRR